MPRHFRNTKENATDDAPSLRQEILSHDGDVYIVNSKGLSPLAIRPPLRDYLGQVWDRRHFIWADARAKALRTTRSYRLWRTWLVLNPLFDVALYGFLFGFLMKTSRGIENFVGFLFLGIIFMRMLTGSLASGSGLISSSRSMIRAFLFPRVSIPFSQTLRAMIDNLLPALVALISAFALQPGKWPTWTVILVIPLYIMIHIFGCGVMMIVARLTAEIPDTKALVGLFTQAWFFLSGIMFSVERFKNEPIVYDLMKINPAYVFLTSVRKVTIYGELPTLTAWGLMFAWTFGAFIVGFIYFWRAEEKYVRLA